MPIIPGVSVIHNCVCSVVITPNIACRVVCGRDVAIAKLSERRAFSKVDLPMFGSLFCVCVMRQTFVS